MKAETAPLPYKKELVSRESPCPWAWTTTSPLLDILRRLWSQREF